MMIEYLSWDSDFFKKKTGKIVYNKKSDAQSLKEILLRARKEEYQLVYVFSREDLYVNEDVLAAFNGRLVDRKIVYSQRLDNNTHMEDRQVEVDKVKVYEYPFSSLDPELEKLAYLSGIYSRFRLDENFVEDDFFRLYKTWIEKSVTKEIADRVYVIKENDIITGMITLKYRECWSEIGLIAVSENVQKKGAGKVLLQKCFKDSLKNGVLEIKVPTQMENKLACTFYEKNGFKIETITNIYHFWLHE